MRTEIFVAIFAASTWTVISVSAAAATTLAAAGASPVMDLRAVEAPVSAEAAAPVSPLVSSPSPPPDEELQIRLSLTRTGVQTGIGLVAGFAWYWRNMNFNRQDWDLGWDVPSWKLKLTTLQAFRFDTNDFVTNAQDHSRAGVAYYLVGRANGLSLPAAFALDVAATLSWEYLVEFREMVSINDVVINSASGPAIGEPLLQIGRFFRRGRPTVLSRMLAALFSPFDELNGWLDGRPWQGGDDADSLGFSNERPHRLQMFASGRATNFATGQGRTDTTFGIDLEVVSQRGAGAPGRWIGWTRSGDISRLTTTFTFGNDARWLGTIFHTATSLIGQRRQDVEGDGLSGSRKGFSLFLGAGTGFDFSTRTLAGEQDRLAVMNLVGPLLDLTLYRGATRLRLQMGAYGDFAMVDSHALGPNSRADPLPPLTGVVRAQGYYYGYGATGVVRVLAECCWWKVDAEIRAHHFDSFDGPNRFDSPLDDAFRDLSDERLFTLAQLAFHPWNGPLGMGAYVEWIGRRGTMGQLERSSREASIGLRATLSH